jgi:hypothetical protein
MYSGQNAQKSAVSAAAGGEQQARQPPSEERDRGGEYAPQHGPSPHSHPFRPEERHGGGQQCVGPRRKEGVGSLQAGAHSEALGPLDVRAHVRVEVIEGRMDHQPPEYADENAGQNGGQGDPVPPVRHHFSKGAVRRLTRDPPASGAVLRDRDRYLPEVQRPSAADAACRWTRLGHTRR